MKMRAHTSYLLQNITILRGLEERVRFLLIKNNTGK